MEVMLMPSLLDALSDGSFDMLNKRDMSSDFSQRLQSYRKAVVDSYFKYNIDLNKSIAKISEKENLNDDQIQRIVEEVNNQVYLIKYNQLTSSPEREVDFDLASLRKIKEIIKNGDTKKPVTSGPANKTAGEENGGSIEKKASWENQDGDDKLNFLNCSTHEFANLAADKTRSKMSIIAEKVANGIKELDKSIIEKTAEAAGHAYTIAEALIKYDRHGINPQEVFEEMCKKANFQKSNQALVKNAVIQKIAQLKEYNAIPKDYNLELSLCDTKETYNEFSLGRYSLIKQAEVTTQSNQVMPVVVTEQGVVKNVNDLVSIAEKIAAAREDIRLKQEKESK